MTDGEAALAARMPYLYFRHKDATMTDGEIIARIQDVRRENNVLWMDLVRLAMRHAPRETKRLLRSITTNDRAVSRLMARLAKGGPRPARRSTTTTASLGVGSLRSQP